MNDFYEIDFLDVESSKSGDAITVRYRVGDNVHIHVVDGGFQETGDSIKSHIKKYYNNADYVDRVVVTHPDGDHAGGLRTILEEFAVGELWMLRPWQYANEIIDRFARFTSVENLEKRLKQIYPNIDALEKIANEKGVQIFEPFQGARIGAFIVMSPSKPRYLDLIVESEKTPESTDEESVGLKTLGTLFGEAAAKVIEFVRSAWGDENFSGEETSAENEMSVIQYAELCGKRILLTGDAGRAGLTEAAAFAPFIGLALPGIDRFQVPHHGSRRNVSTEILDHWLGPRFSRRVEKGKELFHSFISSAKKDEHHPRKSVVRAMIHRGGRVDSTEGKSLRTSYNAPERDGWKEATALPYPDEQEG